MSEIAYLKVLVIEDDEDTQANLQDILELDNHIVVTAASVKEALTRDDLETISVIVTDRRLPDGNAEEFIPQLKSRLPSADIVVVTGHADVESAILALKRGATDYIIKPINPDVLRASLTRTARQIELRLAKERSEANFRELIEAVDLIVVILCEDHRIIYANRFAAETTGYAANDLVGKPIYDLLHGDANSRIHRQLEHVRHGRTTTDQELPFQRPNGDERWVVWHARLLNDFEGSPAVLCAGHDVTERRRLEHRTLQAERLAAIGQMVTGLAHESRNALQRSQAGLELLQDELQDQPEALEIVESIRRAQRHLHHLYEEVRSYAAPIAIRREKCSLDRIWRETWSHLEVARSGKSLTLKEVTDSADFECFADPMALEQVFRNILENAIFVSQPGDEIEIHAGASNFAGRDSLYIRIRDHGPGLNQEQAARIFEPFFTTKTQGTGLGMAIVKRIIEAHGGQISVADRRGPGAEIVIQIPRSGA